MAQTTKAVADRFIPGRPGGTVGALTAAQQRHVTVIALKMTELGNLLEAFMVDSNATALTQKNSAFTSLDSIMINVTTGMASVDGANP